MHKKKIIFFVNSLKFFISHRLSIAEIAYKNNFDIIIVAKKDLDVLPSSFENFKFINLNIRNSNINIFNEIKNIFLIRNIIHKHNPYICHFITVKSIFYASLLYKSLRDVNLVISFSGIGSISLNKNIISIISKKLFLLVVVKILSFKNIRIIFQNSDDKKFIQKSYNFSEDKSFIIPGSGVNLDNFSFKKLIKKNKINFLFASRLLIDKGLHEFIKASNKLLDEDFSVTFTIIGEIDKLNPSNIDFKIIDIWNDNKNKFYYGYQKNIKKYIESSDVVVLPSYREGFPKILIEASSIGRAILTTDVPGCKECVVNNTNGILVKSNDYVSLYKGMKKLALNIDKLQVMGRNSRNIAEKKYDIAIVIEKHLLIYNSF